MGRLEGISEGNMTYNRRAGEAQNDHSDRRVDIVNGLNVRLSILEAAHKETVNARVAHSKAIEDLNRSLNATASALREGLTAFNAKFEGLMSLIKVGFYIICTGITVVIFLISVFVAYNKELDEKYQHTQNSLVKQMESTDTDIQDLKNKKVIKASK